MRKPAPYCSDNMLAMLRSIAAGTGRDLPGKKPAIVAQCWAALRSRGWINTAGQISDAGRAYLASRADK